MFSDGQEGLSFGGAVVAIILGGWLGSLLTPPLVAYAPFTVGVFASAYAWVFIGAVFGAIGVKLSLLLFGYRISYVATVFALFVGNLVGFELPRLVFAHAGQTYGPFVGGFGIFVGLPGLLVSALIVQTSVGSSRRDAAA